MKGGFNNKGFTLVELLAVLVILTAIMTIAIPSISSSLERTNTKQDEKRKQLLVSAAELYVTDHKNAIYNRLGSQNSCYIEISTLRREEYITDDATKDSNGDSWGGCIIFTRPNGNNNGGYEYRENHGSYAVCSG